MTAARVVRCGVACLAALGVALIAVPGAAATDAPTVTGVSPARLAADGRPIHLTITGRGLAGVTGVDLSPVVLQRSFVASSDSTLELTLPADLTPGQYAILVTTPGASSAARDAPTFTLLPAAIDPSALPPPPAHVGGTFAPDPAPASATSPDPRAAAQQRRAAATSSVGRTPVSPSTLQTYSPYVVGAAGVLAGALVFALWGSAGRLAAARRQGILAQAVGRPAERLRLGRICPQCGRLHWRWSTPRPVWKRGEYCGDTCAATGTEAAEHVRQGNEMAPSRLRAVVVYSELEQKLAVALAAEVATAGVEGVLRSADAVTAIHWPSAAAVELRARRDRPVHERPSPP